MENGEKITSVKWNNKSEGGRRILAVGAKNKVLFIDPQFGRSNLDLRESHAGPITALEWKGSAELVVASHSRIERFDMRMPSPAMAAYPGFGRENPVTRLQWNDNTLAASGGNCVRLWDQRYSSGGPLLELQHDSVKGLEFCPLQRNVLATCGANSIHIWDAVSGELESTIPTLDPATSLLWSPYRNELMTSVGETMTIWSLAGPQAPVHRLAEWSLAGTGAGPIVSLDRFPDSGRVISLHKNGNLAVWNPFGDDSSAEPLVPVTQNICALSLDNC
jgi:WD40 repeat protein